MDRFEQIRENGHATILAIETSCDETAAAVVRDGRQVLGNVLFSQIEIHKKFGGVVPEIASRNHVEKLPYIVSEAMERAGVTFSDIDAIAVTYGPGLVGALLTGVSYAKALSFANDIPLVAVNHMEGHLSANFITYPDLEPPFICLLVSGGHTMIIEVSDYCSYRLIGTTRDDAIGEAFDKVARVLHEPYPGGPNVERLALNGDPEKYRFSIPLKNEVTYDYSFSGLKTAVINLVRNSESRREEISREDVAASFQKVAIDHLLDPLLRYAKTSGNRKIVIGGGVSANRYLRDTVEKMFGSDYEIYFPALSYCTDNAAMIGSAAFYTIMKGGKETGLDLNAKPGLEI